MTAPGVALTFSNSDLEQVIQKIKDALATASMALGQKLGEFIELARKLLGDRPTLQAVINDDWNNATLAVTAAETQLSMTVTAGKTWWNGNAGGAFVMWVTDQKTAVTTWKTTLGATTGFIAGLQKASDAVGQLLNGLYSALATLAAGLVDAIGKAGGAVGEKGVDPGKVVEAFTGFISAAIKTMEKAFDTAISAINSYDAAGNLVKNAAAQMPEITQASVRHTGFNPTK